MALAHKALSTREKAREIARRAELDEEPIDLSGVEFIGSSFADELVDQAEDRNLDIVGANDDVEQMLSVVRS